MMEPSELKRPLKTELKAGMIRRVMEWNVTTSGIAATCTACSWWTPVLQGMTGAKKEFDAHVCVDHARPKNPSTLQRLL